jgi:putative transposase
VWAVDFQFDEAADRRRIKLCNIVDEYTREALAIRVGRSCTAEDVVEIIAGLLGERGAPAYLRSENGPEFIAWALRDYCRVTLMATSYIEPGSPWQNPLVESFNGRLRDELLSIEEFGSITEAKVLIEDWRQEYNTYRPTLSTRRTHTHRIRSQRDREQPKPTRTRIAPGLTTGGAIRADHQATWTQGREGRRGPPDPDLQLLRPTRRRDPLPGAPQPGEREREAGGSSMNAAVHATASGLRPRHQRERNAQASSFVVMASATGRPPT